MYVEKQIKAGLHVRRKHKHDKHMKPTFKPVRRKHKRLVLVFMLVSSRFKRTVQRRNDASISTSIRNKETVKESQIVSVHVRFSTLVLTLRNNCKLAKGVFTASIETLDVPLGFPSGNMEGLGETKLTVSLSLIP